MGSGRLLRDVGQVGRKEEVLRSGQRRPDGPNHLLQVALLVGLVKPTGMIKQTVMRIRIGDRLIIKNSSK
jgi:hypothetical protein